MASKVHCDVCDSIIGTKDTVNEVVRIEGPNMLQDLRVEIDFLRRFPHDRDETESNRKDLCTSCQRKVFMALVVVFGGLTIEEAKARIELETSLDFATVISSHEHA